MAPLTTGRSRERMSTSYDYSDDEDEEEEAYNNENDGIANMPEEVLSDLSLCFDRIYDPDNFEHLPIEEQVRKFSHRDLTEGRLYQIAQKFFRGNMRPRKRIYYCGYRPARGVRKVDSMAQPDDGEPVEIHDIPARLSHSELIKQTPKAKELDPKIVAAKEKQEKLDDYRKWLNARKKVRHDLDHMGLDVYWLLNKSDRSPLEEKMLQDMLEKMRKPRPKTPEVVEKKRKKSPKKDPFIRRPVPRILYVIDKHLRLNKIRLIEFFLRTDLSKTWDINRQEFRRIFSTHKLPIKEEELDEMFVCFDKNLNEFIDYRDLAEAMTILRLEKRQIRRTIASGKTISAKDWDSMFSASPTMVNPGSPSRPQTPNQLDIPPSDLRKEQFILSSDEAMVDLRKRDKDGLKNNSKSKPTTPGTAEGGRGGIDMTGVIDSPAFITPKVDKPPFSTGRGPTRSPQWFPPQSRTMGRNTGSNLREDYPDEEIARPNTNLQVDPPLLPEDDDDLRPLSMQSQGTNPMSASSGLTRKSLRTPKLPGSGVTRSGEYGNSSPKARSPLARSPRSGSPNSDSKMTYSMSGKRLAKTPQSQKSTRFSKQTTSTIKTGVKAIDDHMRPSVLGGEIADMTDKFRRLKLKEYYEILKLCQQNDVVFNETLFQRVLLHPGDKAPRELKKIRQPGNELMSAHFADPPQRAQTPQIIKQKGKLKQDANGDIFINSRHLYKPKDQCLPQSERVELSTGRAIVSRKIDCWMSYEEYCRLTRQYEERYIKMNGHVNEDAFWPGYMLDKLRVHMPDGDGQGTGKNVIFSHTKQRVPKNVGYFHNESWKQNDSGYIMFGDITLNQRNYQW